jgi:hypothetical protein
VKVKFNKLLVILFLLVGSACKSNEPQNTTPEQAEQEPSQEPTQEPATPTTAPTEGPASEYFSKVELLETTTIPL